MKFAPNNNEASKVLFTGRTEDLERIFKFIRAGNCVACYGERRSGKTLALEIIQAIINNDIQSFEDRLIDQTFRKSLPIWKEEFANYNPCLPVV